MNVLEKLLTPHLQYMYTFESNGESFDIYIHVIKYSVPVVVENRVPREQFIFVFNSKADPATQKNKMIVAFTKTAFLGGLTSMTTSPSSPSQSATIAFVIGFAILVCSKSHSISDCYN